MGDSAESVYLQDVPLSRAWDRFRQALEQLGLWAPIESEQVALDQALGRVTAEPVWARHSSPHYHAAAMDGYALSASDTAGASDRAPIQLKLDSQTRYVDTGDPLPEGTDAVVPVESVELLGPKGRQSVVLRAPVYPWAHVRPLGEDIVATELVVPAGQQLRPVDLGAVAGCGHAELAVRRRPRVAIIPTGTELVQAGSDPQPGQVIEYNSLVLAAQVSEWGGQPARMPSVADDLRDIQRAIQGAADRADLVLLNAGSSAGSEDYSARAIAGLGQLLVHGVAVRPGHPVILGLLPIGDRTVPIIGVPGYPASAALTGEIFVRPLLRRWLGLPPYAQQTLPAQLTRKVHSSLGDDEYLRVSVGVVGSRTVAAPLSRGAGVINSLVRADGIVVIPAGTQGLEAGAEVQVQLYRSLPEIEQTVLIIGSHDLTLDLLGQHLAERGQRLSSASVGSLGGLIALRRGEAHLAGSHLLDPETGEYNLPYIRKQIPGTPIVVLGFVRRQQGLMVRQGNPKQISGLEDLAQPEVTIVNRQRGAGTRVLLDYQLSQIGIEPDSIQGYSNEQYTHLAVAAAVAAGQADTGMGIQAAAQALGLEFIPLYWERYDLVIPLEHYQSEKLSGLLEIVRGETFPAEVAQLAGYDVPEMGQVLAEL